MIHQRSEAISLFNTFGSEKRPFFFFTDFTGSQSFIEPLDQPSGKVKFDFSNGSSSESKPVLQFSSTPVSFEIFQSVFDKVVHEIQIGNSFLVNLTFRTPISLSLSLEEIYQYSSATYKVLFRDQFVVFSPETFVRMIDGSIYTYPMKGTINAVIPDAARIILDDPKEFAEHITIVDLLRNDLSLIASEVAVTNFRYLTEVKTHDKTLLQVSSEIKGRLPENYHSELGTLFFKLLPAGSISGAPKPKTIEIIQANEPYPRGFYTGVCGLFDGQNLDSGVMIRFIEKAPDGLYYKSGGGITSFSNAESEYQEMIDKIYVPIY